MISKNFFKKTVKCLGDSWGLSVYNAKNKTVNPARAVIFTKEYANENKIIDLPFLPPCESTLLLHVREECMAKLWKTYIDRDFTLPNIQNHGRLDSGDR